MENLDLMYFGLPVLAVAVLGVFLGFKEQRAAFITAIVIFLGTTLSAYKILMKLPFSSILWMERFVSVALIFVLIALIQWKRLKPGITVAICILLAADILPSLAFISAPKEQWVDSAHGKIERDAQRLMLDKAKAVTDQRIAVMDLSAYTAFGPYYLAGEQPPTMCTFGAAWQSAHTASNVVMLNTSITEGYYDYLFDRALEMGNDTVYVLESAMRNGKLDMEQLLAAAEKYDFEFVEDNGIDAIFHREIEGTFGTIVDYEGIAIGTSAQLLALRYPIFQETTDTNLNHYSLEELKNYKKIYLSGFTYDNKEEAEALVWKLIEADCEVYVDMGNIPAEKSGLSGFLGCETSAVMMENHYPELVYQGKLYQTGKFPKENRSWNTVYLVNPENPDGTAVYENKELCFSSTLAEGKIHLLGFNLAYYGLTTKDPETGVFLDSYFGIEAGKTPERIVVPMEISYEPYKIIIKTDYDKVNTGLAYLDSFSIKQTAWEKNHLLIVRKGMTEVEFTYPYFKEGMLLSAGGALLLLLSALCVYQKRPFTRLKKMV